MTTSNAIKAMAAIALAMLPAAASAQSVKAGVTAWQQGDYAGAVATWRPLAVKGDADAAFNLGQAYRLGKGVPLSLASAQQWYETAARKGYIDAATSLGVLLFQNGNRTGAMRWLRQAADGGEPRAQLLYGTALYNGDGVKPDPILAYSYVSRAAAKGLPAARATLADMDAAMPINQRQRGVELARAALGTKSARAKAPSLAKPVILAAKPAAHLATASPAMLPASVAAHGGWRVQLGAFSKRAAAEALFWSLSGGALAGRQAFYISAGAVTRLQVGPYPSRAAAATACASLKGQACFPVAAK